ncbi:transporter [bacterium]|uniref:transporter n=1 Tax=Lachnospiraceae TaxID=186803 RepID=UPI002A2F02C1|nr:transporter [bacterium]MDY2886712.1 transporter [Bariatricus sp.]MCI7149567.1 transporter [bacterium]MDD6513984.1 transporter [bacterium]MDD7143727.1 transporter [bacterium]
MKKYATAILRKMSSFLEIFISVVLTVSIILVAVKLAMSLKNIPNFDMYPNYSDLLENCLSLIIGVEMIRMLYQQTPSTVFEVLLFAIARQIIVEHSNPVATLIGVISIAILFATRKFLFVEFDESERVIFRATSKAKHVNSIIHVHIPCEDNQTLRDVLHKRFEEEQTEIGVGACTYFDNFGLRVAKMHNGDISRVEVIRSIH